MPLVPTPDPASRCGLSTSAGRPFGPDERAPRFAIAHAFNCASAKPRALQLAPGPDALHHRMVERTLVEAAGIERVEAGHELADWMALWRVQASRASVCVGSRRSRYKDSGTSLSWAKSATTLRKSAQRLPDGSASREPRSPRR